MKAIIKKEIEITKGLVGIGLVEKEEIAKTITIRIFGLKLFVFTTITKWDE